ncbi:hypothetical protein CVD28_02145 [Bacillus sp. M6-12]|uniref:hypothetical protein n=1 Tax=Bacillus sp. M6-12 TaxID=2054166 RepID=UPI000C7928F2|nr:hypothetical protein [Bacillus sp. M6-12]PLS19233.1 hypothetical protein CVD28_02145 [Bacillus sp. M6-12]
MEFMKKKFVLIIGILLVSTLLSGCMILTDSGIVKNEDGSYKSISQSELEEYNRLTQEAYEKGEDPEEYAKKHGWNY